MSILVNTQNEQEEKVLLAFLESLKYEYQANVDNDEQISGVFLDQYNKDIDAADAEIENGNFVSQSDVEMLFEQRRKSI
ncbi:hypothetical protein [Pedobacter cryotolerans]|uniref:Uncharacterized protein n=1 Tax=Pedobacter cryotolerans TaxID=2571270 RepID=A0A4U1BWV9_9SPHI|nr:hypothetical protein [Pedobacter cryotolerans]TKB97471.1 hypothetical protein FA045_16040 [Pedobacter cryotolerans]